MITFKDLQEGVYDPNIFKAIFLAGGPGSGKSYVVRKTTGGSGLRVVNSDDAFEALLKKANLSLKMPDEETERRDVVRDRAKKLTDLKKKNYIEGRLGIIIDGTGAKADKIVRQMNSLRALGYECSMIFVNTSLDVALQRNSERPRSIPEKIVVDSWNNVQRNLGTFSQAFQRNLVVVDNNNATDDVLNKYWKQVSKLLNRKVTNGIAKKWIAMELSKKSRASRSFGRQRR